MISHHGLGFEGVSHSYNGNKVAHGVSFNVGAGELVCLLGPSGCGKTTLLRLAAGLERLQKGWISVGDELVADGETNRSIPPEQRDVGLMFQDYALFPHLTIFENIIFGLKNLTPERRLWITRSLKQMGLAGLADTYPHTLSGGQQQRVALLRALAPEPRILLLDEPFSGLDVSRRAQIREETLGVLKEAGVATLMVTHDPEEAMYMADRILIMDEGRIIQSGTPLETYFHPVNAYVAALFGPVNRISGSVRNGLVSTSLGNFDAPGIAEGAGAVILIRPEGLHLAPPAEFGAEIPAGAKDVTVDSARLLGRSSHLRLICCADGQGNSPVILHARISGAFLPDAGSSVSMTVDRNQVFVFPAE
ncbi:MAG: ABC transporter ATP-binding protein [Rhodospirillales bacterium]|nr:ABC transporter ATP-binding protein [Rhodospirillales bacterium]